MSDGTGYEKSRPQSTAFHDRRDAALVKGVRFALGKPDWSPGTPHPPPVPAHLKVLVEANKKEVCLKNMMKFDAGGIFAEVVP